MYDRYIVGGAMPVTDELKLETADDLKASYFLERREMGIINVGGAAEIDAGGTTWNLGFKEALYLGKETPGVVFRSVDKARPAKLYINSAPAHHKYPSKKVTLKEAESSTLGSPEASNHRTINKLIVNSIVPTCQLQMGMTELKKEAYGIQCRFIPITGGWRHISILKFLKSRAYVILWAIRMKRGISG